MSNDLFVYCAIYIHYIMIYTFWILTMISFADAFPASWFVILLYLPLIVRNHIVAAEVLTVDESDFKVERICNEKCTMTLYFMFFCPLAHGVCTRKSMVSKLAMVPNELAPISTIIFQAVSVIFFIVLFAFYLSDNFRIICYVFFIIVYFFNTVLYFKLFAIAWIVGILSIPFGIVYFFTYLLIPGFAKMIDCCKNGKREERVNNNQRNQLQLEENVGQNVAQFPHVDNLPIEAVQRLQSMDPVVLNEDNRPVEPEIIISF